MPPTVLGFIFSPLSPDNVLGSLQVELTGRTLAFSHGLVVASLVYSLPLQFSP